MKIRNGFVSNSSSSSFCIYGAIVDAKNIPGIDKDEEDIGERVEELSEQHNLEMHQPPYARNYYLGRSWSSVKDDETGAQFKASIKEALKALLVKEVNCSTLEAAWYDG